MLTYEKIARRNVESQALSANMPVYFGEPHPKRTSETVLTGLHRPAGKAEAEVCRVHRGRSWLDDALFGRIDRDFIKLEQTDAFRGKLT